MIARIKATALKTLKGQGKGKYFTFKNMKGLKMKLTRKQAKITADKCPNRYPEPFMCPECFEEEWNGLCCAYCEKYFKCPNVCERLICLPNDNLTAPPEVTHKNTKSNTTTKD